MFNQVTLSFTKGGEIQKFKPGFNWSLAMLGVFVLRFVDFNGTTPFQEKLIIILSLFCIILSFLYSRIRLIHLKRCGYVLSDVEIKLPKGRDSISDFSPFNYSKTLGSYFMWKSFYGIKYMSHFDSMEQLKRHFYKCPQTELSLGKVYKTELLLKKAGITYNKDFFPKPIEDWCRNANIA